MKQAVVTVLWVLSAASAAAQVPPPWVPPAGWDRIGDVPTRSTVGYAVDPAGTLWHAGYINADFRSSYLDTLDLRDGYPGRWNRLTIAFPFGTDSAPLFLSNPDTLVIGGQGLRRSTDRGRTWALLDGERTVGLFYRRPSARGLDERVFAGAGEYGNALLTSADRGATWAPVVWPDLPQPTYGQTRAVAAYPAEPGPWGDAGSLPLGRLLFGDGSHGVVASDDDGATAAPTGLYNSNPLLGPSIDGLTVLARPGGGLRVVAFGVRNGGGCGCSRVWTSDDHGATFAETAQLRDPLSPNSNAAVAVLPLVRRPDGSFHVAGPSGAAPSWETSQALAVLRTGLVYRTADGGLTWSVMEGPQGRVPFEDPDSRVVSALLGSDGRVYPSVNERGGDGEAWSIRSAEAYPVAASEGPPAGGPTGLRVSVAPNPSAGGVTVRLDVPSGGAVRVTVYDALGREVARLHDGPAPDGPLSLGVSRWPAGTYTVRATAGGESAAAGLTVAQ